MLEITPVRIRILKKVFVGGKRNEYQLSSQAEIKEWIWI